MIMRHNNTLCGILTDIILTEMCSVDWSSVIVMQSVKATSVVDAGGIRTVRRSSNIDAKAEFVGRQPWIISGDIV